MVKLSHEEFIRRVAINNQHYVNGELEILGEYIDSKTPVECKCNIHNKIWNAYPRNLYDGGGCRSCAGDLRGKNQTLSRNKVQQKIDALNKNIIIVGPYTDTSTKTDFLGGCGHIWNAYPNCILNGEGCPYCSGKRVLIGFNDLATTRPDIARLLKDKNDGYKYTQNSHEKIDFICQNCGCERRKVIRDVCQDGFSCPMCGDGISYPNKFGRAFLEQLPIQNYECEYSPCWAGNYRYDNYFQYKNQEYILEMDGFLHYKESSLTNQSLEERQTIDVIKTNLAIKHGIHIIRIDCLEADCDYIKHSILESDLKNIFDLSGINWILCDSRAQKSLVKEACNLYMSGIKVLKDIGDTLHIHRATVRKYLKRGAKFGWCDYMTINGREQAHLSCMKPVILIDNNGNTIYKFDGIQSCAEQMEDIYNIHFNKNSISLACQTHKPYKGFNFRFANETTQN